MVSHFRGMRANSTKVLFHFDSLVDLHLAVVYALQKDFPSGGSNQCINYSFLHQSKKDLIHHRVFDIGKNVVEECFLGTLRDKYQTIYQSYIEDEFDRVIQDAPITLMLRLLAAYGRIGKKDNAVQSFIFCRNQAEENVARGLLKTIPTQYIVGNADKLDLRPFARIIVGDVRDLDEFKVPQFLHITVLNYGCNLQVVKGSAFVLPEYMAKYGENNQFEIIDSYRFESKEKEKLNHGI